MQFSPLHRFVRSVRSAYDAFGMALSGVLAIAAGLAVLGVTAIVFGGVTEDVTRHNGLSTTDMLHLHWFTEHRADTLVSISRVVSEIGSPVVLGTAAVLAAAWLWMRGIRLGLAVAPGIALCVAAVAAAGAKLFVGRSRPPVALHLVSETNASFPSGHATDSAAFFVTLALVVTVFVLRHPLARTLCVVGSLLAAGCIGISRLILGVHWPTDVLAGWSLGLGVALVVTIVASIVAHVTHHGRWSTSGRLAPAARVFDAHRDRARRPLQAA